MTLNWSELGVFISVCGSVVVSLCFAIQKSKCDNINLCCGIIKCHRKIPNEQEEEEQKEDENIVKVSERV